MPTVHAPSVNLAKVLGLFVVVALLVGGAQASAQGERDEAARQEFQAGRDAYERGDWSAALKGFQNAYALSQHPKLLYNVGLAAQKLGLVKEAATAFEGYLAWGEGDRSEEVRGRLAALRDLVDRDQPGPRRAQDSPSVSVQEQQGSSPPSETRHARKWWPWAIVAGAVALAAVAVAVPLAHRDDSHPQSPMPNTGLALNALWGRE